MLRLKSTSLALLAFLAAFSVPALAQEDDVNLENDFEIYDQEEQYDQGLFTSPGKSYEVPMIVTVQALQEITEEERQLLIEETKANIVSLERSLNKAKWVNRGGTTGYLLTNGAAFYTFFESARRFISAVRGVEAVEGASKLATLSSKLKAGLKAPRFMPFAAGTLALAALAYGTHRVWFVTESQKELIERAVSEAKHQLYFLESLSVEDEQESDQE